MISYHPPAGELGAALAKVLTPVFEKIIRQDVLNFKDYIETKHHTPSGSETSNPNMIHSENQSVRG